MHTLTPVTCLGTLCVFCGSSEGRDPVYREAAQALADAMRRREISLVYGGGGRGLMGILSRSLFGTVPKVTGVIPEKLYNMAKDSERREDTLLVVSDMHERKATMYRLADAFVALPGGAGTIEELMEIFTWLHLGYHRKPVGVLDTNGYYDHLIGFLEHAVREGFLRREFLDALVVEENPETLLDRLAQGPPKLPAKVER